jgi:hypothetical protein
VGRANGPTYSNKKPNLGYYVNSNNYSMLNGSGIGGGGGTSSGDLDI